MKDTSQKKIFTFTDVESRKKIENRIQIVQEQTALTQTVIIEYILYSALCPIRSKARCGIQSIKVVFYRWKKRRIGYRFFV